jgi:hypothetical protein
MAERHLDRRGFTWLRECCTLLTALLNISIIFLGWGMAGFFDSSLATARPASSAWDHHPRIPAISRKANSQLYTEVSGERTWRKVWRCREVTSSLWAATRFRNFSSARRRDSTKAVLKGARGDEDPRGGGGISSDTMGDLLEAADEELLGERRHDAPLVHRDTSAAIRSILVQGRGDQGRTGKLCASLVCSQTKSL